MQTLIFLPLTTSGPTAVAYALDSAPQISGSQVLPPLSLPCSDGRPSITVPIDDVSSVMPLIASARLRPSSFDQKPNVSGLEKPDVPTFASSLPTCSNSLMAPLKPSH